MSPESLEQLVSLVMPYGKYKGRLLCELPSHYLSWFAREGFPKNSLGELLRLMHEIDHNDLRGLLQPLQDRSRSSTQGLRKPK